MAIDTVTVRLLGSVLGSETRKKLFTTVAGSRIADMEQLKKLMPDMEIGSDLDALKSADLIGAGRESKYYVTAKGLKVARDLEELSIS
jgi:hypothetical protein